MTYIEKRLIGALAWLSYAPSADSEANAQELLRVLERRELAQVGGGGTPQDGTS